MGYLAYCHIPSYELMTVLCKGWVSNWQCWLKLVMMCTISIMLPLDAEGLGLCYHLLNAVQMHCSSRKHETLTYCKTMYWTNGTKNKDLFTVYIMNKDIFENRTAYPSIVYFLAHFVCKYQILGPNCKHLHFSWFQLICGLLQSSSWLKFIEVADVVKCLWIVRLWLRMTPGTFEQYTLS